MTFNRRQFLQSSAALSLSATLPEHSKSLDTKQPISCNQYSWITFYQREGKDWSADLDKSLSDYVSTGLTAYEPAATHSADVVKLLPYLKKYKLSMPSLYVNSSLHEKEEADKSIATALEIADACKEVGTKIIVTNPNPLDWAKKTPKSDTQLSEQARNLDRLGAELRRKGMTLAYHTHDVELLAAAREFHHMLLTTDPKNVSLCLDVHWVYRGAGNSQLALFDIVKLYGKRIVELHLRQSKQGIWQENFTEGDIDYTKLVQMLAAINVRPHLVLEQCLEKTSPQTMNGVEAHKRDLAYCNVLFRDWLK